MSKITKDDLDAVEKFLERSAQEDELVEFIKNNWNKVHAEAVEDEKRMEAQGQTAVGTEYSLDTLLRGLSNVPDIVLDAAYQAFLTTFLPKAYRARDPHLDVSEAPISAEIVNAVSDAGWVLKDIEFDEDDQMWNAALHPMPGEEVRALSRVIVLIDGEESKDAQDVFVEDTQRFLLDWSGPKPEKFQMALIEEDCLVINFLSR